MLTIHEIHKLASRSLWLLDPREIVKYKETLHTKLDNHNCDKVADLQLQSQNQTWSPYHKDIYQKLDYTITKVILYAEKNLGKVCGRPFQWSPTLKAAVQANCFWRLKLKAARIPSDCKHLRKALDIRFCASGISHSSHHQCHSTPSTFSIENIMPASGVPWSSSENFLEELAEAQVLATSPSLESMPAKRQEQSYANSSSCNSEKKCAELTGEYLTLYLLSHSLASTE